MVDKEKVIADLEFSYSTTLSGYAFANYGADIHGITGEILRDALALLKAQEPIKPQVKFNLAGQPMWVCGYCGTTLFFKFPRQTDDEDQRSVYGFCNYCGRKVKWE